MFGFGKKKQAEVDVKEKPRRRSRGFIPGKSMLRLFDAAKSNRLTSDWTSMPVNADDVIRKHRRILVARSREQTANNDYAKAFVRMCVQNIVGPQGVQLQAQSLDQSGDLDDVLNNAHEDAWRDWCNKKNCDVTGKHSFRTMQTNCIRSAARDGEFILRVIYGKSAGTYGFALQEIDVERCPSDFDIQEMRNGNFVRHGIEFNTYGRPLAYYFTATKADHVDYSYGGSNYVRVDARDIIHGFRPDMSGQKRGLPWNATALWRLKMLGGYEDAALTNARVSASKMGFFQWDEGMGPEPEDDEDPLEMEVEPGVFRELPGDMKFKEFSPDYPSGEFSTFCKAMLRGAAAGLGVAYNNLANDLENVNFSSIRQGALDERESWKECQEWFIEDLVSEVHTRWLEYAVLAQKIQINGKPLQANKLSKLSRVSWQPRRWQWIDPRADMDALEKSKNNLLQSPSKIIRDQGLDPDTVWRDTARDIQAMKKYGIPEHYIEKSMGFKEANDQSLEGDP